MLGKGNVFARFSKYEIQFGDIELQALSDWMPTKENFFFKSKAVTIIKNFAVKNYFKVKFRKSSLHPKIRKKLKQVQKLETGI
jgi:hypothetical protein